MKRFIISILLIVSISVSAHSITDSTVYLVQVVDYSLSWTSSIHFKYDGEEIFVEEIDNVDKKLTKVLTHRQLFGKEKDKIRQYLSIFMSIEFRDEYINRSYGERNQKRITINWGDKEKNIFVSNFYQQDIAGFITFFNSFLPDHRKMKEFTNPNAKKQT